MWRHQLSTKISGIKHTCLDRFIRAHSDRIEAPFFGRGADATFYSRYVNAKKSIHFSDLNPIDLGSIGHAESVSSSQRDAATVFGKELNHTDIAVFFPDVTALRRCLPLLAANPSVAWHLGILFWRKSPRSIWLAGNAIGDQDSYIDRTLAAAFPDLEINTTHFDFTLSLTCAEAGQLMTHSGIPESRFNDALEQFSWPMNEAGQYEVPMELTFSVVKHDAA